MHIIYAVTSCSEEVYNLLFADVSNKPAMPSQKYHRLLIEGLAKHADIDVVANPPVNRSTMKKCFACLPKERCNGVNYTYIPAIRNPLLKSVFVAAGTFWNVLCKKKSDSVVIIDCLNRVTGLAALFASKLLGMRCVGIVTDLPDMLLGSNLSKAISRFVISNCTDYVILTKAMNDRVNPNGKPYVVLEGHADITMQQKSVSLEKKAFPRVCMYAGAISKLFGLPALIEGFQVASLEDVELYLYGPCDFEEELHDICLKNNNIHYGGLLLNNEIVEKELKATLLVNPRPTNEAYVKYSFPSKNMEYMASGTPLLTTVLPGMPEEYYPYVYLLEEETPEGIAAAMKEIFAKSDDELMQKGLAAKEFILNHKNNVVQAAKILEMLKQ